MPALSVLMLAAAAATAATAWPDEATLLAEINALHTDPAAYAAELRRVATGYRGVYLQKGDGGEYASREGAAAVVDLAGTPGGGATLPRR